MLENLVRRIADRDSPRTEADVQSHIQSFLYCGGFNLRESEVRLEAQAGGGKRIDVEVGLTVIEVKKDLTKISVLNKAEKQIASYITSRSSEFGEPYSGILTDGKLWRLYHMDPNGSLLFTSDIVVDHQNPDIDALRIWLDGALATKKNITPTPAEIRRRLGAESSAFCLEYSKLRSIYLKCNQQSEIILKRQLWARLLTSVFGTKFKNSDELFIEHTYLVLVAKIVAHAVIGLDISETTSIDSLISGKAFIDSDIHGVIENDFFDWVLESTDGRAFLSRLTRRLSRFSWNEVEHDILKVLYESVIDAETRHDLGEYYTPDWLAEEIVNTAVTNSLKQRVLDPACGSGTFLFHAVRKYLSKADQSGVSNEIALEQISNHVLGVDLHPVAVTLARVTYLLAIGTERLQKKRRSLTVPVYLGDSMQWDSDDEFLSGSGISVRTTQGENLFSENLRFPASTISDVGSFDQLVEELASKASSRPQGSPLPSIEKTLERFKIDNAARDEITETFNLMCKLFDEGRDHIWGYFIRNVARPYWLSQVGNQADVLVGNPPWLSYRFMDLRMQSNFKKGSMERGLWVGAQLTAHQDLSSYFVARAVELYLRQGGAFSFLMPAGVLTRQQYKGFRSGEWSASSNVLVNFEEPIDLRRISCEPALFPVPCAIISGYRKAPVAPIESTMSVWSADLPERDISNTQAQEYIQRESGVDLPKIAALKSEYASRFTQGAFVWPRVLLLVKNDSPSPLGIQTGKVLVTSARSSQEKEPWKSTPSLHGSVENQFVRPLRLGATIAPFKELNPEHCVMPWDGKQLIGRAFNEIDNYPGLAQWWKEAERIWQEKSPDSSKGDLLNRLEYKNGTTKQFPIGENRVVYTSSGSNLVAARLSDQKAIVSETLYWYTSASSEEALYLVSILNSETLLNRVKHLQAEGQFGRRHFHKVVFAAGFPLFDSSNHEHLELAKLGSKAEQLVSTIDVSGMSFIKSRKLITRALKTSDVMSEINRLVEILIGGK
jgi:SAM-dependent methyltransferase